MSEENKEVKEEKVATANCSGDCSSCEDLCEDYVFEPVHKKASCANIFSIASKVVAIIYLLIGTYTYVLSVHDYLVAYETLPISDMIQGYCSSVLLTAFAFWAIGEFISLINRIKESIMF